MSFVSTWPPQSKRQGAPRVLH